MWKQYLMSYLYKMESGTRTFQTFWMEHQKENILMNFRFISIQIK